MTRTTAHTCTLPSDEYSDRMVWIAQLNRDALRKVDRWSRKLRLHYSVEAESRVRELVRKESACCGFLLFQVDREAEHVTATLEAPEEAAAAAQSLFDQFSATEPSGAGCGCSVHATPVVPGGARAAKLAVKTSAIAAIACGVCCVVPFVVPAIALTTTGAAITAAASTCWPAMRLAFVAVAAGWLWLLASSFRRGRRPGRATVVAMAIATACTIVAFGWSFMEPRVIAWIKDA